MSPSRRSPGPIVVAAAVATPLGFGVASIGMVAFAYDWMMNRSPDGGSLAVMGLTAILAGVAVGLVARLRGWLLSGVPTVGLAVSVVFSVLVRLGIGAWVGLLWLVSLAIALFYAAWIPSRAPSPVEGEGESAAG